MCDRHDCLTAVQVAHHLEGVKEQQAEIQQRETIEPNQRCIPLKDGLRALRGNSAPAFADQDAVHETES